MSVIVRPAWIESDDTRPAGGLEYAGYEMHMFFEDRGECLSADYETPEEAAAAIKAEYKGRDVDGVGIELSIWTGSRWKDFSLDR